MASRCVKLQDCQPNLFPLYFSFFVRIFGMTHGKRISGLLKVKFAVVLATIIARLLFLLMDFSIEMKEIKIIFTVIIDGALVIYYFCRGRDVLAIVSKLKNDDCLSTSSSRFVDRLFLGMLIAEIIPFLTQLILQIRICQLFPIANSFIYLLSYVKYVVIMTHLLIYLYSSTMFACLCRDLERRCPSHIPSLQHHNRICQKYNRLKSLATFINTTYSFPFVAHFFFLLSMMEEILNERKISGFMIKKGIALAYLLHSFSTLLASCLLGAYVRKKSGNVLRWLTSCSKMLGGHLSFLVENLDGGIRLLAGNHVELNVDAFFFVFGVASSYATVLNQITRD